MKKNILIWLVLMALTLMSFFMTESSSLSWVTAAILVFTAFKGMLIVDGFMELSGVNHILRKVMLLYTPVVGSIILYILMR